MLQRVAKLLISSGWYTSPPSPLPSPQTEQGCRASILLKVLSQMRKTWPVIKPITAKSAGVPWLFMSCLNPSLGSSVVSASLREMALERVRYISGWISGVGPTRGLNQALCFGIWLHAVHPLGWKLGAGEQGHQPSATKFPSGWAPLVQILLHTPNVATS